MFFLGTKDIRDRDKTDWLDGVRNTFSNESPYLQRTIRMSGGQYTLTVLRVASHTHQSKGKED